MTEKLTGHTDGPADANAPEETRSQLRSTSLPAEGASAPLPFTFEGGPGAGFDVGRFVDEGEQ